MNGTIVEITDEDFATAKKELKGRESNRIFGMASEYAIKRMLSSLNEVVNNPDKYDTNDGTLNGEKVDYKVRCIQPKTGKLAGSYTISAREKSAWEKEDILLILCEQVNNNHVKIVGSTMYSDIEEYVQPSKFGDSWYVFHSDVYWSEFKFYNSSSETVYNLL